MSCDGFGRRGIGQEDVMRWRLEEEAEDDGFRVVGQEDVVMDLGWWVRRMSCDGCGVVGQEDVM